MRIRIQIQEGYLYADHADPDLKHCYEDDPLCPPRYCFFICMLISHLEVEHVPEELGHVGCAEILVAVHAHMEHLQLLSRDRVLHSTQGSGITHRI